MAKKLVCVAVGLAIISNILYIPFAAGLSINTAGCPDVKIIFARGSGAQRYDNSDYQNFRENITTKLANMDVSFTIDDLDYPAVGVENITVAVGAYFGAGEAYEFGESVDAGVKNLKREISSCPTTKYVLAGYSQGALVVDETIQAVSADKIIYVATFGDPKIYLPEGAGIIPPACFGNDLSEYRMYVPNCRTHEGKLGSFRPYEPSGYNGKVGTWCNKNDIFCSPYLSIDAHTAYVSDNLYEDASRVIVDKIADYFKVERNYISPHDTAILIDSTGSMSGVINAYKSEAIRLARETFAAGGRVALYDFKDLRQEYWPVEHCGFETCTEEILQAELDAIVAKNLVGGGDWPESDLNAALVAMESLNWRAGATKSIVILTDASYHDPDLDGTTLDKVVKLSKEIDPVNIYVVTSERTAPYYEELTVTTGGSVAILGEDEVALTDLIVARYDTLPRVEEELDGGEMPEIIIDSMVDEGETVRVNFISTGGRAMVILNDAVLGVVEGETVSIGDLDRSVLNTLRLVPINDLMSGEGAEVVLDARVILKAPNTGRM